MTLHFGTPQTIVLITFIVIALLLAAVFTVIALSSREDVEYERVARVGYAIRDRWFIFLLVLIAIQLAFATAHLPYSRAAKVGVHVQVSGGQFYWSMSPTTIPAGAKVEFNVTSVDVNHGFGIYNPDGSLIGSVQAMPGYHNKLDLTLKQPGTYLVSCLEFCGIKHDRMQRTFKVVKS